jgi:hypothetical protein
MFLDRLREDKYIVQIYVDECTNHVPKYPGHEPLERSRGIAIPLLHYMGQGGTEWSGEGRLPHIAWNDADLLVSIGHVNLGPVTSASYIHPNIILIREWCDVFDSIVITLPRIYDRTKFSILLRYA